MSAVGPNKIIKPDQSPNDETTDSGITFYDVDNTFKGENRIFGELMIARIEEAWKEYVEPTDHRKLNDRIMDRSLLIWKSEFPDQFADLITHKHDIDYIKNDRFLKFIIAVTDPLQWISENSYRNLRECRTFEEFIESMNSLHMEISERIRKGEDPAYFNRFRKDLYNTTILVWEVWRSRITPLMPSMRISIHEIFNETMIWFRKHPDKIEEVAWDAFEKIVAEIFASHGFSVDLTGRNRNRSADIIAVHTDGFGVPTKYLIEAKHYRPGRRIGLDIVNAVLGAKRRANVEHAFLVTTSSFTRDVKMKRAEWDEFRLHLFDGEKVKEWLRDYKVRSDGGIWLEKGWDE